MRYLFAFALCIISLDYASAQNALVQMFHPQYHEVVPLVTDSMYVRIQNRNVETTRAIGFRFLDGKPNGWREKREINSPHNLWIFEQYDEVITGGKIIYEIFIDSLILDTVKSRQIILGGALEYPDSVFTEVWRQGTWEPQQKTVNFYNADHLLLRKFDWKWDVTASEWENLYSSNYSYDGKKRITQRQEWEWTDTSNLLRQNHFFAYRNGENKPKYEVWYAGTLPLDSTAIWYDANSAIDSMQIFEWDNHNQIWKPTNKRIFDSPEAKTAGNGKFYLASNDPTGGATAQWIQKERREFVTGNNNYTDEPEEEILRKLNPATGDWEEYWRRSVQYTTLSDSGVYAKLSITERNTEGSYAETFFAEAWLHSTPDSLQGPPVDSRTDKFTFSYKCGFYSPYVQNQTLTFPATEASGNYELKIFAEDSRLVYRQMYDSSGLATVNAPLAPGVYFVAVSKGGVPLCTQKLVVQ